MKPILGCVADDLTGATDLALTLKRSGLRTIQVIGVPGDQTDISDADAVVVALKSRSIDPDEAVAMSIAALTWLQARECRQFFFKYCSTFDSTDRGNIGPVCDAMMAALGARVTIACPAFPENGRTVYQGHLFVGDRLLSESPLKDHPLNPMTDSDLVRVLGRQSRARVALIPLGDVAAGADRVKQRIVGLDGADPTVAIVDAITDEHLVTIGHALADCALVTGGSGIAMGLADNYRAAQLVPEKAVDDNFTPPQGMTVAFAGSCSKATREQLAIARTTLPSLEIDPVPLLEGEAVTEQAISWMRDNATDGPVLIYSSDSPEQVSVVQKRFGREESGSRIEEMFAELARAAVDAGVTRFVVAGGETSGAVVNALDATALRIGPEIDPGVPWTVTTGARPQALALKSGNFGAPDFFAKAIKMLEEP